MKSEPDCYSIDDLEREMEGMWEGCRNYTVRNFMRDRMKPGDRAFFYHSSVQPAGIVGEMEIVTAGYPDPTQFDPNSEYFDAKSPKDTPRWMTVNVRFARKYSRVLSLAELKEVPGLESMEVLKRGQRLSVMPVTDAEWEVVTQLVR